VRPRTDPPTRLRQLERQAHLDEIPQLAVRAPYLSDAPSFFDEADLSVKAQGLQPAGVFILATSVRESALLRFAA
jgi:hypothetical protein